MTDAGEYVEIQGTGEDKPFSKAAMEEMLVLGESGIGQLAEVQKAVIGELERA